MQRLTAYLVFVCAFAVYLVTASPLITAGDSGELVTAAAVLGVPHPPGYPLFCLVGKAFSLLPVGNVAGRLNVMSAVFSAVLALLAYLIALAVRPAPGRASAGECLGAAGVALAMAFTGIIWGQATSAEVYPLQAALSFCALYALLLARGKQDVRYVYLFSLVFGLSVTAHYSALLLAPGFAFFLFYAMPVRWDVKKVAVTVFFAMLPLSVFIYLAPRAYAGPPINWGNPETLKSFIVHITRASYGDLASFGLGGFLSNFEYGATTGTATLVVLVCGLLMLGLLFRGRFRETGAKLMPGLIAAASLLYLANLARKGLTLRKIEYFVSLMSSEHWALLMAVVLAGAVLMYFRDRAAAYMLGLNLAAVLVVSLYRVPVSPERYLLPLIDKFFIPFMVFCGIFAAYGVYTALSWLGRESGRAMVTTTAGLAVLVLPAAFLNMNYAGNDRSCRYYAYDFSASILRGMEQDAVFLVEGDNVPFLSVYQRFVEQKRPDVEIFEITGNIFRRYDEARMLFVEGLRPLYCSQEQEVGAFPGIRLERSGLVNRFPFSLKKSVDPWEYYEFRLGGPEMPDVDHATKELIANYFYYRGRYLMDKGEPDKAYRMFQNAAWVGNDLVWVNMDVGNILRDYFEKLDEALVYYDKAARLTPGIPEIYIERGKLKATAADYDGALSDLETAARLSPNHPQALMVLGMLHEAKGEYEASARYWQRCLEYCDESDRPFARKSLERVEKALK